MISLTRKRQDGVEMPEDMAIEILSKMNFLKGIFVKQIACSDDHTIILLHTGDILVTGNNRTGQLGLGDTINRTTFTLLPKILNVKNIVCGRDHTMILLNDGTVLATGSNYKNVLGLNKVFYNKKTRKIENKEIKTVTKFTQVFFLPKVKQIASNQNNTIIISNDGRLYVNGANNSGILGLPDDGRPTGGFKPLSYISNVKTVVRGLHHSMILLNDGNILGAGLAMVGELGFCKTGFCLQHAMNGFKPLPYISNVKQIFSGTSTSMILLNDGTILGTGNNTHGQLGLTDTINRYSFTPVPDIQDVKQIASNKNHTMILLNNGTILGTGDNHDGRLGLGDQVNRTTFTLVPDISNVKQIVCGYNFTMIILHNGTILKSGMNDKAGLNEQENSLSFIPVTFSEELTKLFSKYDIIN